MAELRPSWNKLNPEACESASIEGGAHPLGVVDFVDVDYYEDAYLSNDDSTLVVALCNDINFDDDMPMPSVVKLVEFMARLKFADEIDVHHINNRLVIKAWWG